METNTKRSQAPGSSVWEWYKDVARNHHLTLELLDETLSKLLFWIPHSDATSGSEEEETGGYELGDAAWREVGYGILSLHRLSLNLALDEAGNDTATEDSERNTIRRNHYGMSIRTQTPPTLPATGVRICLTVIHSILPSLISLAMLRARTNAPRHRESTSFTSHRIAAAASKVRLLLEQVKFLLRLTLLVPYWRQQQQPSQLQYSSIPSSEGEDRIKSADYGIMLDGGLYHSDQHQESIGIPWDHALALQRRRNYVGERTGWKSGSRGNTTNGDSSIRSKLLGYSIFGDTMNYGNAKIAVAELLYAFRPLLWAWFESRYHTSMTKRDTPRSEVPWRGATSPYHIRQEGVHRRPSLLKGWIACLAMDLLSIRLLEERQKQNRHHHPRNAHSRRRVFPWDRSSGQASRNNPFEDAELQRRKLRLFLYLLRSPVWSTQTLPALEGISQTVLRRIPLLGNLVETVLWDWILYYQHPFVAEEG